MPKKITNITLHDTPDGSALTVTSGDAITDNLAEFVTTSYKLRDNGSLTIRLVAGSSWMQAAAAGTRFTDNQTIKLTYDDATESYWRVVRTQISHDGSAPTVITCWPYWTMLDRRAVRVQRSPNSFVDITLALTLSNFKRLFSYRLVRENPYPDFSSSFDVTSHCSPCGLNLPGS